MSDAFIDVFFDEDGSFTIPRLKWRELLFIQALRPDGDAFVRDPDRPIPLFAAGDVFPVGRRFRVLDEGDRVRLVVSLPAAEAKPDSGQGRHHRRQ